MKRDQFNDQYLDLVEKQRLYFKTVKDFKEVTPEFNQIFFFIILLNSDVLNVWAKIKERFFFQKNISFFPGMSQK